MGITVMAVALVSMIDLLAKIDFFLFIKKAVANRLSQMRLCALIKISDNHLSKLAPLPIPLN